MRINHNLPALNALRNLSVTQGQSAQSMEKLTSSLRISRAADDAAGLAISETMRGQIKGLNQASRNSQDAISLLQTAEGALTETHSILERMRELATQAANDTYTSSDRIEIQKEVDQLRGEIDRIGNTTAFNGKNLLDGSASAITSTDKTDTQVFVRGAIAKSGSYKLSITAQAGKAQIQKSNIFQISSGNPVNKLNIVPGSGVNGVRVSDLQQGDYSIDTSINNPNAVSDNSYVTTGTLYAQNKTTPPTDIFNGSRLSVDAANTDNISLLAQVAAVSADGKNVTYQMSWHSLAQDGATADSSTSVTLDLTQANTFTLGNTTFNLKNTVASNSGLTVGDKQVFTVTGNTHTGVGAKDTVTVNRAGSGALANVVVDSGVLNNTTTDFKFYSVDAASGQSYDGSVVLNVGGLTPPASGSGIGFSNVDTGSIVLTGNLTAAAAGTPGAASTGAINFNVGNLTAQINPVGAVAATGAIDFNTGNLTAASAGSVAVAATGAVDLNAGNLTAQATPAIAAFGAINLTGNLTAHVNTTNATALLSYSPSFPQSGTKVTVAGITYTWGDGTGGTVAIGSGNSQACTNLANAIRADGKVTVVQGGDYWNLHLTAATPGTAGNFTVDTSQSNGQFSVSNVTNGTDGVAGDTVTVGTSTYTAGVDFAVGGNANATAANLAAFLNGKNGVTASATGGTVNLTAAAAGATGNAIALAENSANATVSGSHLTGGADTVVGGGSAAATGIISLTGNLTAQVNTTNATALLSYSPSFPQSGTKVTVAGITYTWGDGTGGTIAIGSGNLQACTNLANAIRADGKVTVVQGGDYWNLHLTAATPGTAGNFTVDASQSNGQFSVSNVTNGTDGVAGDTVIVGISTYTAGVDFAVGGNANVTAANLAAFLNGKNGVTSSAIGGTVNLTAAAAGTGGNAITLGTTSANAGISGSHLNGGANGITGDAVNVNGTVLTAGVNFNVGGTAAVTAANLANYIHANTATLGVDATYAGGSTAVDITANTVGAAGDIINLAISKGTITAMNGGADAEAPSAGDTVTVNGHTLTAGTDFNVGGNAAATASNLANYIHANSGTLGVDATNVGGTTSVYVTANTPGLSGNNINLAASKGTVTAMSGGVNTIANGGAIAATGDINLTGDLTAHADATNAYGLLSLTFTNGAVQNGDQVEIAGTTYIFGDGTGGTIAFGDGSSDAINNLMNAIITDGKLYVIHPNGNWFQLLLGAKTTGTAGTFTVDTSGSNGRWGINNLTAGNDAVAGDTITVGTSTYTAGVDFAVTPGDTAATANSLATFIDGKNGVTATSINGTIYLTAATFGTAGNNINLAETSANATVSGLHLAGGVDGIPGDTVSVNGNILRAGVDFNVGGDAAATASNLANYIHAHKLTLGVDAAVDGGVDTQVNITAANTGAAGDSINLATSAGTVTTMSGGVNDIPAVAGDTITINGHIITAGTDFNVGATAEDTASNLATYIHNNVATLGVDAAVNSGVNSQIDFAAGAGNPFTLAQTGGNISVSGTPLNLTVSFMATESAGQTASLNTKLSEIDKFIDASGANIIENPQTLQLIEGDGKKTTIQLYGSDTIQDVVDKLNTAIGIGLGQKDLLANSSDADKFASFVFAAPGSGEGSLVINSAKAGADGKIYVVGAEKLLNALGLSDAQSATETQFNVTVTDVFNPSNIIASNVATGGNQLIGIIDQNVDVKFAANSGIDADWDAAGGKFALTSSGSAATTMVNLVKNTQVFQIGANENQQLGAAIGNMGSTALGIANILVTDRELASKAIGTIDAAISKVSAQRSSIGAVQNRLEHTINNLGVASENLTTAESRIRDIDMSSEMIAYTKLNILNQASMAMLAQANKSPQMVLQLLQG